MRCSVQILEESYSFTVYAILKTDSLSVDMPLLWKFPEVALPNPICEIGLTKESFEVLVTEYLKY